MTDYSIEAFREEFIPSYDVFIENTFGKNAYQKSRAYIEWLYFANPYGRGYGDFKVILTDGLDVIGCFHKIRFRFCDRNNNMIDAASIHNLMIDKDHRNRVGFLLVRNFSQDREVFPGSWRGWRIIEYIQEIRVLQTLFLLGYQTANPKYCSTWGAV